MNHKPTNILFPAEMMAKLAAISKSTELSVSEHVRRAVDMYCALLTEQYANAIGHVTRRGACGPTMSDETLDGDQPAPPTNSKCLSGYELPDDGSPCPKCGAKEYETCKRQENTCYEIQMPGLPLDQVRYVGSEGQNIWHYPRLYVDGNSWVWKYAILRKPDDEQESAS